MRYPMEQALAEFARAIGAENAITAAASLEAAETATFATAQRIPAILRPADREQVRECVRIANRWGVRLYPVSSGRNWGYGSRVPAADDCVLLDLGRLNRILDYNEDLAYVTLEPGVTQGQLYDFLQERGGRLWMDATGSSPHCSLVGNATERGFGHTPYGDRFANACALEIVLPDGGILETGLARFAGAHAAPVYRWGAGPSLDGLFSQSNFGIVTRMTLWLMPAPEYFQAYYFRSETDEGLPGIIDALRPLRLQGVIRSASHIANDYKVVSALQQYPWERTGGRTPLDAPLMAQLRRELRIGAWNGSGALYGTRAQVKESRRLLRQALRGKASRLQFLDDGKLRMAARFAGLYQRISGWDLKRTLALLRPVYGLMKGIPTDHPLASAYWRKRTPPPQDMDPDRDRCGLLWCSPIAPTDGAHARRLTNLVSETMLAHAFEPVISLTMLTERALSCIVSLTYDRDAAGEDERAMACYRELLSRAASQGYYSYRLGIGGMFASESGGAYGETLRAIKQTLDPRDILAPGRYVSSPAAAASAAQEHHLFAARK